MSHTQPSARRAAGSRLRWQALVAAAIVFLAGLVVFAAAVSGRGRTTAPAGHGTTPPSLPSSAVVEWTEPGDPSTGTIRIQVDFVNRRIRTILADGPTIVQAAGDTYTSVAADLRTLTGGRGWVRRPQGKGAPLYRAVLEPSRWQDGEGALSLVPMLAGGTTRTGRRLREGSDVIDGHALTRYRIDVAGFVFRGWIDVAGRLARLSLNGAASAAVKYDVPAVVGLPDPGDVATVDDPTFSAISLGIAPGPTGIFSESGPGSSP